jgi:hypothetical protein
VRLSLQKVKSKPADNKKCKLTCPRHNSTTKESSEQVLYNSPVNNPENPVIPAPPERENGFGGIYDDSSLLLRNSTADPNWNDIAQPAPANFDLLDEYWRRSENSLA